MSSSTTRWGIIGTGRVAALFAEGLADAPGARLAGVCSRTPARASAFASRHGASRAHPSAASLANDPEVDIVYVATPNVDHRNSATAVLEAGKPVVCEKPFAMDGAEARAIVELARERRVFCMEAMWMRFIPAVRELVERIGAGDLGEVRSATIELGHPFVFDANQASWSARGGGALLDLGPYVVSLAQLLFGRVSRVQSEASLSPSGADDHVSALLRHVDGQVSSVAVSLRTRLSNGASIAGTQGLARLHEPLYRPEALSIVRARPASPAAGDAPRRGAAVRRRLRPAINATRTLLSPLPSGRTLLRPCRGNGYQYQAIEAMRCLRAGELESPLMPLDATVQVMETLDAIRKGWAGS